MSERSKRTTVYLDPSLHQALRMKAAITHLSISEIINDMIRAQVHRWDNPDSGHSGSITLLRRFMSGEEDCVEAHITINKGKESLQDKRESYCRSEDGVWELYKNSAN